MTFNPLTAGPEYIRFFYFSISTLSITFLYNMLMMKSYINQQDLKIINHHFVKSE